VLAALITSPFTSTTIAAPVTATVTGGGGSGATAFASLGVTPASFSVTPNTQKYSVLPNITVTGGGGGSNAIVVDAALRCAPAVVSSAAYITAPGFGYSAAPTVTVTGGTTSGAGTKPTVTANANNFQLMGIQITAPGSGYTSQPTITLSGAGSGTAVGLISSVTLASATSIGGPGNMVINSAIGDNGSGYSVTKVGAGTVTLGGVNTYAEPPRLAAANSSASLAVRAPAARSRCNRGSLSASRFPTARNSGLAPT
jgi:fibronectin-binding autotransporter adhesin